MKPFDQDFWKKICTQVPSAVHMKTEPLIYWKIAVQLYQIFTALPEERWS